MRRGRALAFKGYFLPERYGHATRSTSGALYFDVECEGATDVVLKPVNTHCGPKLVVNELVCTELAYRLGLPTPEPLMIEVPSSLGPVPLRHVRGYVRPGPAYAIPFLPESAAPPSTDDIRQADNVSDLPGVVVFDTWIANRDRTTPGNLLATPSADWSSGRHIWMVDQGHGITGPDWTAERLGCDGKLERLPYLAVLEPIVGAALDEIEDWVRRIQALSRDDLREVVSLVPYYWLPKREEREALVDYLFRRAARLETVFSREAVVADGARYVCDDQVPAAG